MSVKTYSQLLTAFADNTTGQITPEDMRDFVDSVELKYDNWTVVKPGQPLGNKFPAPSGGEIVLPDDSVWVINGTITVDYPISMGNNVTIIGLSGSYTNDAIYLDTGAGAVPLIKNTAPGGIHDIADIALVSVGGTGTLFDIADPSLFRTRGALFAYDDGGSIDLGSGSSLLVLECIGFLTDNPIQVTGSGDLIVFDGIRSGFSNNSAQFDIQVNGANAISISNCYNASNFPIFFLDETNAVFGIISNSININAGLIATGIDETSISWTLNGNSGQRNTQFGGSLNMSRNTTTTVNGGLGSWVAIVGNGNDVLSPSACRVDRSAALEMEYTGKEEQKGVLEINVSLRRATLATATPVSIGIFKNGSLITTPKTVSLASITRVGTLATATLSAAFPLVNGMTVTVSGADQPQYNGTFVISGVAGLTFQYTMASDPGASATGTLLAVVPVENVVVVRATDVATNATLHIETDLAQGDLFKPYIRPDATGTVDFVAESVFVLLN